MNDAVLVALGSAITGVIGAIFAGVVMLYKAMSHSKATSSQAQRAERKAAIEEWQVFADRQGQQITRLESHIVEQQQRLDDMAAEHASCQIELTAMYGELLRVHDFLQHMVVAAFKRLGEDVPSMPPLPQRPRWRDPSATGFAVRTSEQANVLAMAVDARLRQQAPTQPPTTQPGGGQS